MLRRGGHHGLSDPGAAGEEDVVEGRLEQRLGDRRRRPRPSPPRSRGRRRRGARGGARLVSGTFSEGLTITTLPAAIGADQRPEREEQRVVPGREHQHLPLGLPSESRSRCRRGAASTPPARDASTRRTWAMASLISSKQGWISMNSDSSAERPKSRRMPSASGGPVLLERRPEPLELLPAVSGRGVRHASSARRPADRRDGEPRPRQSCVEPTSMACLMPGTRLSSLVDVQAHA